MFPRIVLGLYRAELAIAQKDREQDGALEYGREKPSEIARRVVGEALHLGPDRVRDLCAMGRRHEKEGMPPQAEMTAANFREALSTTVPSAAAYRELFSLKKDQCLSDLRVRLSAGRPIF